MNTKLNGILTLLLAFVVQLSFAQTKTVSGNVSDETGPLLGVSIVVKGTTSGTETDFDGNYTITASVGDVLQFSFIGMITQEVAVGTSSSIKISLKSERHPPHHLCCLLKSDQEECISVNYFLFPNSTIMECKKLAATSK